MRSVSFARDGHLYTLQEFQQYYGAAQGQHEFLRFPPTSTSTHGVPEPVLQNPMCTCRVCNSTTHSKNTHKELGTPKTAIMLAYMHWFMHHSGATINLFQKRQSWRSRFKVFLQQKYGDKQRVKMLLQSLPSSMVAKLMNKWAVGVDAPPAERHVLHDDDPFDLVVMRAKVAYLHLVFASATAQRHHEFTKVVTRVDYDIASFLGHDTVFSTATTPLCQFHGLLKLLKD